MENAEAADFVSYDVGLEGFALKGVELLCTCIRGVV
jgi:hypothetical protein